MTGAAIAIALVQLVLFVFLSPLLIGVIRQVRARLEGRAGAGIWQPWRDVRKLLTKDPVRAADSSWMLAAGPVTLLVSSLLLVALLPLVGTLPLPLIPSDLFVIVSVMLIGVVALALVGLDAGTAFGGMGSSRHMTVAALVEPTLLLAVYALSIPAGTSTLSLIVETRLANPAVIISPVSLLAMVALAIAIMAETSRLPVDNPSTHLELTMLHEAMVLEASGRDLAWLELGSWLKLAALLGLLSNLIVPWGVLTEFSPLGLLVGVVTVTVKILALGVVLSVGEVFLAKARLFRVPELLAGSFALALLAVTASYLVA
ncbi:formate hydrogenlyase [Cryobacterium sp. TMT1-21]|uniref:Formate hydrogenlyase n=1 Tax=Cryobacterium shii TaxID=1259235 RepID=A0AAQ2C4B1_9MICO|nr:MULTISPECIES: NADH-quinone oxidoreductase subunit H [Cryobacterium]TFC42233.1 formate hydrogenlyase [Cryobacterium shii]TFC80615.1 formate hydrogenlyase [Cryobacterium sp. TmT2-59]TFD12334.1 formate hydrogenlyase [Cryobacterium sp. TMT4-10]TFD13999.1 formate hydrogenlyase [Cryobacterium sp. TMT1-21]TFD22753.1 formate hydrogenlyase [Cryobacterium sp. TMT2-23]